MRVLYFESPEAFRAWLEKNHAKADELWVGYWKKGTGKSSLTWPESVDEALCYGWIDGIRKSVDEDRYKIRFTPRRPKSKWSDVNLKRVAALKREKRMRPAGIAAFEARVDDGRKYSFERRQEHLDEPYLSMLRENEAAFEDFSKRPPGYRRTVVGWILDAKREETRLKRLRELIACSTRGRKIPPLRRKPEE